MHEARFFESKRVAMSAICVACLVVFGAGARADAKPIELFGVRIGMTPAEVVAACSQQPDKPHILENHDSLAFGTMDMPKMLPPGSPIAPGQYVSHITCGSGLGITDAGFSRSASAPRVTRINRKSGNQHMTAEAYVASLIATYGKPVDEVTTPISDPGRGNYSRTLKWLYPRDGTDCAPREGYKFVPKLIEPGPCATDLRIEIYADLGSVTAVDFDAANLSASIDGVSENVRRELRPGRSGPVAASIADDMKQIGRSRSQVFGLPLGQALNLPQCTNDSIFDTMLRPEEDVPRTAFRLPELTCRKADNPATAFWSRALTNLPQEALPPDVSVALVVLASNRCPDWVSAGCLVAAVMKDSYVIGVMFLTANVEAEPVIAGAIAGKYGSPTRLRDVNCQGVTAKSVIWDLPRLSIAYQPLGGPACRKGRVSVVLQTLNDILTRNLSQVEASEPKM
jgi:hypothetical protein